MHREPPHPAEPTPAADPEPPPYDPPAVIWEEKWEPVVLAVSCARLPGQSASCNAAAHSP